MCGITCQSWRFKSVTRSIVRCFQSQEKGGKFHVSAGDWEGILPLRGCLGGLPNLTHKPKQTKTSQNLKPPNIPISSPKVQNSEAPLKLTQVSASFQSPKMKRTPKYKIVLNSKSERGKVIVMMMMMMALSFVHLVCDPGIGFHLILQSLLLSHFTVTLFFPSRLARKNSQSHG